MHRTNLTKKEHMSLFIPILEATLIQDVACKQVK